MYQEAEGDVNPMTVNLICTRLEMIKWALHILRSKKSKSIICLLMLYLYFGFVSSVPYFLLITRAHLEKNYLCLLTYF